MFGYLSDFDRTFQIMDQLRRRMDRVFEDYEPGPQLGTRFPPANLYDAGQAFVIELDLPGVRDKDLKLTIADGVLTVQGERGTQLPEGHQPRRRERAPFTFSRSFNLPSRVDAEKVNAELKNGVLTVRLEKAAEVQPRQINVRAS